MARADTESNAAAPGAIDGMFHRAKITHVLRLSGGKAAGESNVIIDPFTESGSYGKAKGARRVLVPPLGEGSLRALCDLTDESNILSQCIAAYETNIDGFGYKLEHVIKDEDFPQSETGASSDEHERLNEFFAYGYAEGSFVSLRKKIRHDIETTGCGYAEILRDTAGLVNRISHVPSYTLRQTVYDPEQVVVSEKRQVGLAIKEVKVSRRFRTYIQIQSGAGREEKVWFKEFGDPRSLDRTTGAFSAAKTKGNLASEILVFPGAYHPTSPYGVPRWVGNMPSIFGSRAAEEINLLYFDNKAIPPMIITISGGVFSKGTMKRIENLINHKLKGRENFHEPLIIEAVPGPDGSQTSTAPRIEIKPLTDAAIKDALFMGYDQENRNKVRSSFRLSPIYTGESQDYTRATAEAAMLVVEEQVFRPERVAFDYIINRWLLPEMGSLYHKFTSLGPNVTMNDDLISALGTAEATGGMTPNIARRLLADITESEVDVIDEPWGNVPFTLTLANIRAEALAQAALLAPPVGAPGQQPPPEGTQPAGEPKAWRRIPRAVKDALLDEVKLQVRREMNRRKIKG